MLAVLAAGAAFGFAASVFYLLPKFLAGTGASASAIGAATSAFGLATVGAAPFIALWIDSMTHVRLVRTGCVLMAASSAAFATIDGYGPLLIVLRCVQGCAFACVFTALSALVAELAPPRRLSEALGLAGASMLAMNAIAPAVVEPLAAGFGWSAAFLSASIASTLALLATARVRSAAPRRHGPDVAGLRSLLRARVTIHYAVITAAVGGAFGAMFTYPQPFALELGRDSVRGFFVAYTVLALGARVVLGGMADRVGRFRMSVFALNLYTLVVLAGAGLRPMLLEPLGAMLGLAHGLFFPAFNAGVIAVARSQDRNKLLSVFTGAFYGGLALAALPLGALAEAAGYPAVFVAASAGTFCAGGLLIFSRALADPQGPRPGSAGGERARPDAPPAQAGTEESFTPAEHRVAPPTAQVCALRPRSDGAAMLKRL